MGRRTYGQFCGLARALELVGERWSLLVVRDLVLGPKRFTDLQRGLPRIPASILSTRLNELEEAGVVRRRVLPQLDASVVYELTEYGSELEPIVLELGLWGARSLGRPDPGDAFTLDAAILALHATFRPDRAESVRVSFEIHFGPGPLVHAIVDGGVLKVSEGPYSDADLVVRLDGPVTPLLSGEVSAAQAVDDGLVRVTGEAALLELFQELFHIPARPVRAVGLAIG
ncbi:MAG TPA: helix-turn-helix domain-containing protein [Pseudonocardia sp.]|nr:helix-turn-helix domain-containing protein [Pseudonocardia sp.]